LVEKRPREKRVKKQRQGEEKSVKAVGML